MSALKRVRVVLIWVFLLVACVGTGGLIFAFTYVTDSDTLADLIRRQSPRFFPGSVVEVGRVQMRPLLGEVTLSQVRLVQKVDGRSFTVGQVAWMNIKHDLKALWQGRFEPREVVLVQPTVRVCRRADGTWNVEGLLADPWPAPPLLKPPVVRINAGTLQIVDETMATTEGAPDDRVVFLRDVVIEARGTGKPGWFTFEASARGGPFDRVRLEGSLDHRTGQLFLTKGDLSRLTISETFCRCLPELTRERFRRLGLSAGEVDLTVQSLEYDPKVVNSLKYEVGVSLRGGTLTHPALPDALTQLEARATVAGGTLQLHQATGRNGKTLVRLRGVLSADEPADGPLDLNVEVTDLDLDERLRAKAPPEVQQFWAEYRPQGRIDFATRLVRETSEAPVRFGLTVNCKDVGLQYDLFPYPLQHVRGMLVWEGSTVRVDLRTLISGDWVSAKGTVENPGPDALVKLDFRSESFPIDETLRSALAPDIREVFDSFQPTGTVRGVAHLRRGPENLLPGALPFDLHLEVDLNPGCSIRWEGLPYLVRELSGHLDLRPDRWVFSGMKGSNGPATLTADGEVNQLGPLKQSVTLNVRAENLPFDQQLRDALPPEWQVTWATLNPSGQCHVDARIRAEPDEPPHYHLTIVPVREQTRVRLVLNPVTHDPNARTTLELPPMENVSGTFVFDDGNVTMSDVDFRFREAPVHFRSGTVLLQDSAQFDLQVQELLVTKLRLDAELRTLMPPVMSQFARRLDDGRPFWLRGDLRIGWSGRSGEPARCDWSNGTIVLDGNTIQTGLPLEDLHGQFDNMSGWSDGQDLALQGNLNLESVRVKGLQITRIQGPVVVEGGWARLDQVRGAIMGGQFTGSGAISLDATPRYRAGIELNGADLAEYTRLVPGNQNLKGRVSGRLDLQGEGNDLRTLTGTGWALVQEGDVGKLPMALRWVKVPNFRPPTKTAFDRVEVGILIGDGQARLEPVKLTGDAFSLSGMGTVQLQGDQRIDMRLSPAIGRDERRVPVVSDVVREASGRVFDLHVSGPLESPTIRPEPLPDVWTRAGQAVRRMAERREDRQEARNP